MYHITLTGRVPSKKNSRKAINVRGRTIMIASDEHKAWHKDASAQLMQCKNVWPAKPLEVAQVTIELYAPDKRESDLTNKAESVMDLLVDNGILKDDNWFVVGAINLRFGGVDREHPRVEIDIRAE